MPLKVLTRPSFSRQRLGKPRTVSATAMNQKYKKKKKKKKTVKIFLEGRRILCTQEM
jgi:hypothetical protein